MQQVTHKRGDTFSLDLEVSQDDSPLDLTGYTITSQIRTQHDVLVADLTVTVTNAATGQVSVSSESTTDWPTGEHLWDVEFYDGSSSRWSIETVQVKVLPDVTRPSNA